MAAKVTPAEPEKACTKCGVVKPLSGFTFDKRHDDGRQSQCRACTKERQRIYKVQHPDRLAESKRKDYQKHRDRYGERRKKWAQENPDKVKASLERTAARRLADPELAGRRRATSRRYADANREVVNARSRDWARRNPGKVVDYRHVRRAVVHGVNAERVDVLVLAERDGWICGICYEPIDPTLAYPNRGYRSIDHVIPLSKGGDHTYENIRIAHWYCNVKRGAARGETWPDSNSESSTQLAPTG